MSTASAATSAFKREQAERRRAVDEDVIETIAERRDESPQLRFAAGQRDHFDFCARQIAIGRQYRQVGDRRRENKFVGIPECGAVAGRQNVVDGASGRALPAEADAARQIGLRIDVNKQHLPTLGCERRG